MSTKPAFVNGVAPTSPGVLQPLLVPVPALQSRAMMYEPAAAPASSIVIGLADVRLVLSANAYSVKLVGAAKPFFVSPPTQLPNVSESVPEPGSVRPS